MYANAGSRVRVGEGLSQEFEVKVGVHQGSVLSPLLFIIALDQALSHEFRAGVPWEDLYADDLAIIADSLEEALDMERSHGEGVEGKCGKDIGHDLWYRPGPLASSSGNYPCTVCRTGVGSNSIYCNGCKLWLHKKCSELQ